MLQKKISFLPVLLLICCMAKAQNFHVKATLQPVTASGFYSIDVTPQLSSYATINFSDVRIADDKNDFVPYIIRAQKNSFISNNYSRLPILKYDVTDSGKSELIIQNEKQEKISSLALMIKNAVVDRYATISGSDDAHKWFIIAEDVFLEERINADTDRYIQTIKLPASAYRYFKIVIDNKKNNPLNIIEAGSYSDVLQKENDSYVTNPSPRIQQIDSTDNYTYLKIHQAAPYHVTKILLQVESPKYYNRNISFLTSYSAQDFKISSDKSNDFNLTDFNDNDFVIKIYNGDNPSLKISTVTLQQQAQHIIAYLQKDKNYYLLLQNSAAVKPVYDLQQFEDSIPSNPALLKIISFENTDISKSENKPTLSAKWIWVLIVVVISVLGFISFRLVSEMKKKGN